MSKMIAFTPNPALDLSGEVQELIPNEKNAVRSIRRDPGGNSINSGRIASRLGADVTHLFWSGGPTGKRVESLLRDEKQKLATLPLSQDDSDRETRTNITVTQLGTRTQTRLSFPGPQIRKPDITKLITRAKSPALRNAIWLVGGSLPPGFAPADLATLLTQIRPQTLFLDVPTSVLQILCPRTPAPKPPRWRALLMKPNLQELSQWWGSPLTSDEEIRNAALALSVYTDWVCISMGSKGAQLIHSASRTTWMGTPPPIHSEGSVGAGDSMVGAMAYAYSRNPEITGDELLRWGLAGGAATAASPGTHLGSAQMIRTILKVLKPSGAKRASGAS